MTLQQNIIREIQTIEDLNALFEIQNFLQNLQKIRFQKPNTAAVLQFAGSISDEEAKEMKECIDSEFNNIEAEW